MIASFIRGMVADVHDVDDLVQLVAETCARKFDQYDPQGGEQSFLRWSLSIARFEVLRYYKRQKRTAACFSPETMDAIAAEFERTESPQEDRLDALRKCLGKVTDRNRQLVEMKYFRDLHTDRIADRLGLTSSGVRVALHRTRQFLADCVQRTLEGTGYAE